MLELKFKCDKCKKIEVIKDPTKEQEQPFCFDCGMPMFLEEAKLK